MDNLNIIQYLHINLGKIPAYVFMMKVKDLQFVSYTAVRGRDKEKGAVQRVLSPIRLRSIEDYILKGNTFYTPFFVNWTNDNNSVNVTPEAIQIPYLPNSAQILDGQHRLAGFERAIQKKQEIENTEVLIVLTIELDTKDAASVFLNINTEQRPVPKSLIYDLFGVINEDSPNLPLVRAKDIAMYLQKDDSSPYQDFIKLPGAKRGVGVIDLSTVVNAVKPLLEDDGAFRRSNIETLENQVSVIINYFNAIKVSYSKGGHWYSKSSNPFFTNAGFIAAVNVLSLSVIPKCVEKKDFTQLHIENILNLNPDSLMLRSDIKNVDGKAQRKMIASYLEDSINNNVPEENAYKF